jgi:small subunit ribosomal protein S21
MQIVVRDNNVDQALRALKKKLQREGVYREMKLRRHYEKPSEKRARAPRPQAGAQAHGTRRRQVSHRDSRKWPRAGQG